MSGELLNEEQLKNEAETSIFIASRISAKLVDQHQYDSSLMPPINFISHIASLLTLVRQDDVNLKQGTIFEQMDGTIPNQPKYKLDCRYFTLVLQQILDRCSELKPYEGYSFNLMKLTLQPYVNYHPYIPLPRSFEAGASIVGLGKQILVYSPEGEVNSSFSRLRKIHPEMNDEQILQFYLENNGQYQFGIDFVPDVDKFGKPSSLFHPRLMLILGDNSEDYLGPDLESQVIELEKIYRSTLFKN